MKIVSFYPMAYLTTNAALFFKIITFNFKTNSSGPAKYVGFNRCLLKSG